jgi:uncharacterized membrane protein YphA (DoxX/SURF4 family)
MQFPTVLRQHGPAALPVPIRKRGESSGRLWVAQGALALLFLFAGGMKLVTPADTLAEQSDLPVLFMRFIGLCEFLGGAGLVLPGIVRIATYLTPLAAAGLVVIMAGATVLTFAEGSVLGVIPGAVGLVAAYIALRRGRQAVARRAS